MSAPPPNNIAPPGTTSFTAYARHRGCSVSVVSRAIKNGRLRDCLTRDANGKAWIASLEVADREWEANKGQSAVLMAAGSSQARAEEAPAAPRASRAPAKPEQTPERTAPSSPPAPRDDGSEDDDEPSEPDLSLTLTQASAIEKHWKAKLAKLEYKKKAGLLIEAAEVELRLVDTFTACRTKLLGVPTRARQRLPHLAPEDTAVLEELVREALEELTAERKEEDDE
jgi:hypothetical protein